MSDELVHVEREDGYAIVAFNRPDRMNALIPELLGQFESAMAELDDDPDIEVVILTGRGRNFCAGLDVEMLKTVGPDAISGFNPAQTIANWNGPVIAAVAGVVVTGGFEITVACDCIIAAESTRFIDTHSRVGLLPGWGLSARLHNAIGLYRAKELELTGRPLYAREAADWGLANRVVPDAELLNEARKMAKMMVTGSPKIAAPMKELIDGNSMRPLGEALKFEREYVMEWTSGKQSGDLSFKHVGGSKQK